MKMRSTFKALGASALALSLAFCSHGATFPDHATFKPRVTHDVDFAFGVNLDKEQAFKVVDAYADLVFDTIKVYEEISDKEIAEAKGKIAAFKEDPFREAPGDVRAFLEKSGLRNVELYWAVLSLESFEIVDETPQLGGFSLAVAGTIDLERFISALRQEESIKVSFEETQVEGERAWHIVPQKRDKEIERAHIDPYVASLDGRLVLVATSRDTLVKQIRLYRTGRGRGDALGGFSGVAGELAHLHVSHIGGLVRKYAPLEDLKEINQFVPDGDRLILGLEDLDVTDRVSPRGMLSSTLVLRTASEKDAETLRTLAKAGLMVLNAKIAHEPKVPDFVKKLVRDVKVGGMEGRFEVQSPLPLSTGCLILPAALFPVVSSAMLNANASTLSIQGRKIIIGIIQANIEREGKLGPVWPRTNVDGGGTDDIASHVSTSATDYFNALFDMEHYGTAEWDPVVDGELLSALSGAGVPGMSGRRLESRNVAWNIAANVTDETPDFMPVLISANFNPKLLAPCRFDGRDDTPLPIGPKSGAATSMFGDKAIVIVRKSGAAEVIKKKYLTRATLYNNQSFDISGSEKIPIKWLTPTGVVTPASADLGGLVSFSFEKVKADSRSVYRYALIFDGKSLHVEVDDVPESRRHVRESVELSDDARARLAEILSSPKLYRLAPEYVGSPSEPGALTGYALHVISARRVLDVSVENASEPEALQDARMKLEAFAGSELNLHATRMPAAKRRELSADARRVADAKWAKPERGLLLVKTDPAGATVTCRGSSLGITPLLITSLPCGQDQPHKLKLSLNGYKTKPIDVLIPNRTPLVREEKLVLDSGILDCDTEPVGATVLVNGIEHGKTPLEVMIPREGAKLTFRCEGFKDEVRSVDGMSAGERKQLVLKLEGTPARLSVVTEPDKAKVYLDGKFQGMSPVTGVTAVSGEHEIRVELSGHAPATRKVRLENGGDTTEKFTMESVLGRIEVVTTPPGAKISVDGKAVGTTRPQGDSALSQILLVENVSAGEHAVLAHLDGYYDQSLKVTVRAKETKQLPFTLRRGFTPDTEVELINGLRVSGLFKREDNEQVVLEIKNGMERPIPRANIRKVTSLRK